MRKALPCLNISVRNIIHKIKIYDDTSDDASYFYHGQRITSCHLKENASTTCSARVLHVSLLSDMMTDDRLL